LARLQNVAVADADARDKMYALYYVGRSKHCDATGKTNTAVNEVCVGDRNSRGIEI
jgi:hypothetical protein